MQGSRYLFKKQLSLGFLLIGLLTLSACFRGPSVEETFLHKSLMVSKPVAGAQLIVHYDPGALEFAGIASKQSVVARAFASDGQLKIGLVAPSNTAGELLTLKFKPLAVGTASIAKADGYTADGQSIPSDFSLHDTVVEDNTNYDLNVQEAKFAQIRTANVQTQDINLQESFADFRLGDLNRDNVIDVIDVLKQLAIAVGSNTSASAHETYHSDLSGDGIIDVADVVKLLDKAVNPKLAAELHVAPAGSLTFDKIKNGGPILVGNAGNQSLPTISATASSGMTLKGAPGVGIDGQSEAYQVFIDNAWKYGDVSINAGSAGRVDMKAGGIVLLIAGQSNATGNGQPLEPSEPGIPEVRMLGNDYVWKQAEEPVDDPVGQLDLVSKDDTVGHSLGVKLGKELFETTSRPIYLIPSAKNGSSASQWKSTGALSRDSLFGSANYRAQTSAGKVVNAFGSEGGPVSGIIWYQGETDANSPKNFILNTNSVMDSFVQEISPDIIVYAQLGMRLVGEDETEDFAIGKNLGYQRVREDQRKMEAEFGESGIRRNGKFYMVVTHDLAMSDQRHLSAEGQKILGERVARVYRKHVLGEAINSTGPRLRAISLTGDKVKVKTSSTINNSSDYENYFTVFVDGDEKTLANGGISSISRDGADPTAAQLVLASTPSAGASVTVRYMPNVDQPTFQAASNVIKDGDDMPLPAFGPLEVPYNAN